MPEGFALLVLLVELGLIGLAAGLLGGMLGIGGGIIMIPALTILMANRYFGTEAFHLYKLAAITTTVVLSIPAVMRHARAKAIVPGIIKRMIPAAVIGVVLGVALSATFVSGATVYLRRLFGAFLIGVVIFNIYQAWRFAQADVAVRDHCPLPGRGWWYTLLVGVPTGFVAGLLGVGGGVWAVPMQRLALGVRMRHAIANSAATILPVAVTTVCTLSVMIHQTTQLKLWHGFAVAAVLAPGALAGAWFGAGLTHRLPAQQLRLAFQILLAIAGLRLLLG